MVIKKIQHLRRLVLIVLIRKELKFIGEIQVMIDNDPSKSIRSLAVSKFLIWLVVHEDICYFSYKMRKNQSLSQAVKKRKSAVMLLNKLKHSFPTEHDLIFLRYEKFLPRSDG